MKCLEKKFCIKHKKAWHFMLALFRTPEVFDYLILPKYYDVSPRQTAGEQQLDREEF